MYDWIIVADIYRLEKIIRQTEDRGERAQFLPLLDLKRRQLRRAIGNSRAVGRV